MTPDEIPALKALEDAICDGGTIRATCDYCGVTHYNAAEDYLFDDMEFAVLEEAAARSPDLYRTTDSTISQGAFLGRYYVWGCRCEKFLHAARAVLAELPALGAWAEAIAKERARETEAAAATARQFATLTPAP